MCLDANHAMTLTFPSQVFCSIVDSGYIDRKIINCTVLPTC